MNYLELISNDEDINNESYKKEELNSLKVLNISISLTNFEECELKDSIYENVHFDKVNFNTKKAISSCNDLFPLLEINNLYIIFCIILLLFILKIRL